MSVTILVLFVNGLTIWVAYKDTRGHVSRTSHPRRFVHLKFLYFLHQFMNLFLNPSPLLFPTDLNATKMYPNLAMFWEQSCFNFLGWNVLACSFYFQIRALRGSADFLGLNHYTSVAVSPSSMEPEWNVPSFAHDIGVKEEQDPSWPRPGVEWLAVTKSIFY